MHIFPYTESTKKSDGKNVVDPDEMKKAQSSGVGLEEPRKEKSKATEEAPKKKKPTKQHTRDIKEDKKD